MTNRLETLLQFYDEDPSDPFNVYAVALEYLKRDPVKAGDFFNILLQQHPDYLPTYYHAAKLFADLNDRTKAIEVFEKGISLARTKNDNKAMRELQSAYNEFTFE